MYSVNGKPFEELLEAIEYCKARPTTTLTDSSGTILMQHQDVPHEMYRDIQIAKQVLAKQLSAN